MHVTGFTFIKNAVKFDYPIVESITSILPICDEFVVAVGKSEDDTMALIYAIDSPKIRIIETVWAEDIREDGRVLALETDKAFQAIGSNSDWCFYIQGDEVVHEKYLHTIKGSMQNYLNDTTVQGLLFKYKHFYGSYDYVATASHWYKKEIRIVRNDKNIYSFRDAQGFRIGDDRIMHVKEIDAFIYHYGWVKPPGKMQDKQKSFQKLWHKDDELKKYISEGDEFDYSGIDQLEKFTDSHPKVIQDRINKVNWSFTHDLSKNKIKLKDRLKNIFFNLFGLDFNYKNYKIIKD